MVGGISGFQPVLPCMDEWCFGKGGIERLNMLTHKEEIMKLHDFILEHAKWRKGYNPKQFPLMKTTGFNFMMRADGLPTTDIDMELYHRWAALE